MAQKPAWSAQARTGPVRKFKSLSVFACEGLVVVIDERPGKLEGDYTPVLPNEMMVRIQALRQPYRNKTPAMMTTEQRVNYYSHRSGIAGILECIKEARHMGDPSDPQVQDFWARHYRRSSVGGGIDRKSTDAAGYPVLPTLPRGKDTGKTVLPDGNYSLHRPPVRKNKTGIITS